MFIDKGKGRAVDPPDSSLSTASSSASSLSVFGGHGDPVVPRKPVIPEEPVDDYVFTPWSAQQKKQAEITRFSNILKKKERANMRAEYEAKQKREAEARKAKEQAAGETERQKKLRQQEEEAKKNREEAEAKSREILCKLQLRTDWQYPIQTLVSVLL